MICTNAKDKLHVNESELPDTSGKKYILAGVFATLDGKENRNGRIYTKDEYLKHLQYLREDIRSGEPLLGELDHPDDRFEVKLKEASHRIIDLWYDPNTRCVMGKIELLNTPNGKLAQSMVDQGIPLHISSRAAGSVNPDHTVSIQQIYTYDLVCKPGFADAVLHRVDESANAKNYSPATKKFLSNSLKMESLNSAPQYGIINENVSVSEIKAPVVLRKEAKALQINKQTELNEDMSKPLYENTNPDATTGKPLAISGNSGAAALGIPVANIDANEGDDSSTDSSAAVSEDTMDKKDSKVCPKCGKNPCVCDKKNECGDDSCDDKEPLNSDDQTQDASAGNNVSEDDNQDASTNNNQQGQQAQQAQGQQQNQQQSQPAQQQNQQQQANTNQQQQGQQAQQAQPAQNNNNNSQDSSSNVSEDDMSEDDKEDDKNSDDSKSDDKDTSDESGSDSKSDDSKDSGVEIIDVEAEFEGDDKDSEDKSDDGMITDVEPEYDDDSKSDDKDEDKSDDSDKKDEDKDKETSESEDDDSCDNGDKPCDEDDKLAKEAEKLNDKASKDIEKHKDSIFKKLDDLKASIEKKNKSKEEAKCESVIMAQYPVSMMMNESNFATFATLSESQKNKVVSYLQDNNFTDAKSINENWKDGIGYTAPTPVWLKYAPESYKALYESASDQVKTNISNMAKYVLFESQNDINTFWENSGLQESNERRLINESFVNTLPKVAVNESQTSLPYGRDFIENIASMASEYNNGRYY